MQVARLSRDFDEWTALQVLNWKSSSDEFWWNLRDFWRQVFWWQDEKENLIEKNPFNMATVKFI